MKFADHDADYRLRFGVLQDAGVVERPKLKTNTPLRIRNRATLDELGVAFFASWIFKALLRDKVSIAIVPLDRAGTRTGLVVFEPRGSSLVHPRSIRTTGGEVDSEYLQCAYDRLGALPPRDQQVFCPVLNKLRLNVGSCGGPRVLTPFTPRSSDCCGSAKDALWKYVEATVLGDPDTYGPVLGGSVLPLNLSASLVAKYMTGTDGNDWGKWLDEVLLWHAMDESGVYIGNAHTHVRAPFESFEIDFLLRICDPATPDTTQALCVFETTIGHRKDLAADDEAEEDGQVGFDHPKNKLINHLAVRTLGLRYEYHYLCITESAANSTLTRALGQTEGFSYWRHDDTSLASTVQNHLANPVPARVVRNWYGALVSKVRATAKAFAAG